MFGRERFLFGTEHSKLDMEHFLFGKERFRFEMEHSGFGKRRFASKNYTVVFILRHGRAVFGNVQFGGSARDTL
jgi:hypothetical protein